MSISYAYSWFGLNMHTQAKSPLQVWNKKEEDECHKKHSLIESGWTNQQDMSKVEDNIALSLSKTQARMMMGSKMQPVDGR